MYTDEHSPEGTQVFMIMVDVPKGSTEKQVYNAICERVWPRPTDNDPMFKGIRCAYPLEK